MLLRITLKYYILIELVYEQEDGVDEGKGDHRTDEGMATNSDNAKTVAMPSQKSGIDHFNSSETDPKKSGAMSKYLRYVLLTSVFKEIKSSSKLFLGGRVTFFSLVFYICFADDDLLEQGVLFGKLILFFTTTVLLPHGKCFELVPLLLVFLFFFSQCNFKCHIWNLTYSLKCCVLCLCF